MEYCCTYNLLNLTIIFYKRCFNYITEQLKIILLINLPHVQSICTTVDSIVKKQTLSNNHIYQ